jgi:hypothetical protein
MKPATRTRALKIPKAFVFATAGLAVAGALACAGGPGEPGADASADGATRDSGTVDGCVYQLCNGGPSCPGIVCLPPSEECPTGCGVVV